MRTTCHRRKSTNRMKRVYFFFKKKMFYLFDSIFFTLSFFVVHVLLFWFLLKWKDKMNMSTINIAPMNYWFSDIIAGAMVKKKNSVHRCWRTKIENGYRSISRIPANRPLLLTDECTDLPNEIIVQWINGMLLVNQRNRNGNRKCAHPFDWIWSYDNSENCTYSRFCIIHSVKTGIRIQCLGITQWNWYCFTSN